MRYLFFIALVSLSPQESACCSAEAEVKSQECEMIRTLCNICEQLENKPEHLLFPLIKDDINQIIQRISISTDKRKAELDAQLNIVCLVDKLVALSAHIFNQDICQKITSNIDCKDNDIELPAATFCIMSAQYRVRYLNVLIIQYCNRR